MTINNDGRDQGQKIREKRILSTSNAHAQCREILKHEFYNSSPKWLVTATFTLLMINLGDIVRLLKDEGNRLEFSDDLEGDEDITTAVKHMRDAVCHIASGHRVVPGNSTLVYWTDKKNELSINGFRPSCEYTDDVAFYYGKRRLYLNRHLKRVVKEAEAPLKKLVDDIPIPE